VRETLADIPLVKDAQQQRSAFETLLPRVVELELMDELLPVVTAVAALDKRAKLLVDLLPHLPEADQRHLVSNTLTALAELEDSWQQHCALEALLPKAIELGLVEALPVVTAVAALDDRATLLVQVLPHLLISQRQHLVRETLADIPLVKDVRQQRRAMRTLLSVALELSLIAEILPIVTTIIDIDDDAKDTLLATFSRLPLSLQRAVLTRMFSGLTSFDDYVMAHGALAGGLFDLRTDGLFGFLRGSVYLPV
jgi:hypothetical protein